MPKLQFEITDESMDHLKRLVVKSGCAELREMMVKAFAILDVACDMEAEGGFIFAKRGDGTNERLLLFNTPIPPDAGPKEAKGGE